MKKIFVCAVALCACSCVFAGLVADAGGDYLINPGEEITLIGSSPDFWPGAGQPCHIDISPYYGTGSYDDVCFEWHIDDILISSQTNGMPGPQLSYDYLINELGLGSGEHTVQIYTHWTRYVSNTFPPGYIPRLPPASPYNGEDLPPSPPLDSSDSALLFISENSNVPEPATMLLLLIGASILRKK